MAAGKGLFRKGRTLSRGEDRGGWRKELATKYLFSISQAQHCKLLGNCSNYWV